MVEAENGSGECGGGLLVDITAEEGPALALALAQSSRLVPPGCFVKKKKQQLTTVSDARQARVMRLRESAESW